MRYLGDEVFSIVITSDPEIIDFCTLNGIYSVSKVKYWLISFPLSRANSFGLPYFSSILQTLFSVRQGIYPLECQYYAYANGDILLDFRMDQILDLVHTHQLEGNLKQDVLLVGRRTNTPSVNLYRSLSYSNREYHGRLLDAYKKYEQFMGLAMDYFIFSKSTFRDDFSPDVVVGRDMIDSYIYHYGLTSDRISVIDCSNSRWINWLGWLVVIALHQTGKEGNWGNKKTVKSEEDDQWNKRIVETLYNLSVPLYKTTFLSPNQIGSEWICVWNSSLYWWNAGTA